MKVYRSYIAFFWLVGIAFMLTGCIDKTFKPEAVMEITTGESNALIPTATDTASLPEATITVTSINTIPCNLKSFSINYYTRAGEMIPGLNVPSTSLEGKLAAAGTLAVTIKAYTKGVVELFELSNSSISPIIARINLVFKDYNDNFISKEANFFLFEPDT